MTRDELHAMCGHAKECSAMPAAMMTDLGACVDEAGGVDAGGGGDMCPAACKRVFNGTMVGMQHCMEMGMGVADGMGSASMWEDAVEQVSASATGVSEAFVRKRRLQFAVHFDGNEVTIENLCDVGVFITLILHHMTPVAGKISHRDIHQLVLALRSSKGLGAPFLPGHRIIAMQSQIG